MHRVLGGEFGQQLLERLQFELRDGVDLVSVYDSRLVELREEELARQLDSVGCAARAAATAERHRSRRLSGRLHRHTRPPRAIVHDRALQDNAPLDDPRDLC